MTSTTEVHALMRKREGLDLTLVEGLAHRGLGVEICRRYLSLVESKAEEDGETRVLAKVAEIQSRLPKPD